MGFGIALLVGVVVAGVMIATMRNMQPSQDQMKPQGLDSFQMTQNSEGQVVPMVWGKVRLTTNLLWYGNLETQPVYSKGGGKGGKPKKQIQGYKYWMDMWHSICQGPNVTLEKVYIQDRERDIADLPVTSYTFNAGDTNDFPTEPGQYASPLVGVAHIFLDHYLMGVNVTNAPTIHFVVSRTSNAPLTYANMANGVNPAAIIYDLLLEAGVPAGFIDIASFEDAATYWNSKGYGLNITLTRQAELKDHVNTIFTYVDGCLQPDENDKFVLTAFKDTDTAADTVETEQFKEFRFTRRSWDDVHTDFRANFIDEDSDYTKRSIRMRNSAVHSLIGHDRQKSIDLTGFRDGGTASSRLWELMKKMSYPEAQIKSTVGMRYAKRKVGEILDLTHSDYGIINELYRIVGKDDSEHDQNSIELELTQVLESLMELSDTSPTGGGTSWIQTHPTANPPDHQRILELPYTAVYGESPAYLCLAARASQEDGFTVLQAAASGGDYAAVTDCSYFSQYGTIAETYPATTYQIDDETGIRFTPDREDPEFDTISRAALFSDTRIAVLYDPSTDNFELVAFQTVTPIAQTSDYRLTGVIRGLMNTTVQQWVTGKEIWLVYLGDNIITDITAGQFYLKLVPFLEGEEADESLCTEITVNYAGRAKTPWPPTLVKATRSGSTVTVTVWPTTRLYAGAGATDGAGATHGSVSGQTDQWPPQFTGSFNYTDDAWATSANSTSYTWDYTKAGAHTLAVKALANGYLSSAVSVSVGAGDADYYGPTV